MLQQNINQEFYIALVRDPEMGNSNLPARIKTRDYAFFLYDALHFLPKKITCMFMALYAKEINRGFFFSIPALATSKWSILFGLKYFILRYHWCRRTIQSYSKIFYYDFYDVTSNTVKINNNERKKINSTKLR